ncbi:hypothetical protein D3C81_1373850 [compost metagenome]
MLSAGIVLQPGQAPAAVDGGFSCIVTGGVAETGVDTRGAALGLLVLSQWPLQGVVVHPGMAATAVPTVAGLS